MYNFLIIKKSIEYSVFFFATFTGHTQPYTPAEPLEFDEIHNGLDKYDSTPYYQGWYSESKMGPRLDKFIKYFLLAEPMELDIQPANKTGVYYHKLEKIDNKWKIMDPLLPSAVLKEIHYLRYIVDNEGKVSSSLHIFSSLYDSYEYKYSDEGLLLEVEKKHIDLPEKIPDH